MKKLILILSVAALVLSASTSVMAQPYTPTIAGDTYDTTPDGTPTANSNNDGDPDIYRAINDIYIFTGLGSPGYTSNEEADGLQFFGSDNIWKDLSGADNSGTFILIGLRAANSNTLGIYEAANPANQSDIFGSFSGTILPGEPFRAREFSPGGDFGWTLNSVGIGGNKTYSSNPFLVQYDNEGLDHMMTYHLPDLSGEILLIQVCDENGENCGDLFDYEFINPYLLAWEDLPLNSINAGKMGDEDYDDIMFLVDRVGPAPIPEPLSMVLLGTGLFGLAGVRLRKRA